MTDLHLAGSLSAEQWNQLNPGDDVVVQREGESPHAGQIDAITDDGKIFWVQLYYGRGRILVHEDNTTSVHRIANST